MNSQTTTSHIHHPLHQRVCATPAATDAIRHLHTQRGKVTLHHVDGDECEVAVHAVKRPLVAGRTTVCAGIAGGSAFCVDRQHDAALGFPDYLIDVAPDPADEEAEPRLISRIVPGTGSAR